MKRFVVPTLIVVVFLAGILFFWQVQKQKSMQAISTFQECVDAGYPVMESYPEKCMTTDGRAFVNNMSIPQEGTSIRVKGEIVCLPHKDTSGMQTLECAYGIKSEDGIYYALHDSDPEYKNISSLPSGEVAVINGKFSEDPDSIYDIVGVIEITSIEK